MVSLENKIVLITGASSGIGRELAHESSEKGATVILCARNVEKLEEVRRECEKISHKKSYVYPLDVSDVKQIDKTIKSIMNKFNRIDVLFNNAGFGITGNFMNMRRELIFKMFQVNVLGLMYITQLVAIEMSARNDGHIFNTASFSGKVATPKSAVYSASKSAVISFSDALRMELKPFNIKVTVINTGPVKTPFLEKFGATKEYYKNMKYFMLKPEKVAKKAVRSVGKTRREINLPLLLSQASILYQLFPRMGDFFISHYFQK